MGAAFTDATTELVIGSCIEVHRALGPGLLESAYERCVAHELALRGLRFARQVPMPLSYKDVELDCGYRLDFVVDGRVIVELKAVEELSPIHVAQVITYLRLSQIDVGLLINFNVRTLKDGIRRLVRKKP